MCQGKTCFLQQTLTQTLIWEGDVNRTTLEQNMQIKWKSIQSTQMKNLTKTQKIQSNNLRVLAVAES